MRAELRHDQERLCADMGISRRRFHHLLASRRYYAPWCGTPSGRAGQPWGRGELLDYANAIIAASTACGRFPVDRQFYVVHVGDPLQTPGHEMM